jgi:hypothetical protein
MFAYLIEGLTDAIGFVVGALLGYGVGAAFGLDLFAPGYGTGSIIAILLVGLGGGSGLQAARRFRAPKADAE